MSTWTEHLEDRLADAGYLAPAIDESGDHVTLVDAPVSEVMLVVRETLLSKTAVERAARTMDENFNPDRHPIMAAMFRDYAKTALTAAIEGDE